MARPRRVREDPALRRAQILDEALRLIGERGFNGFTIQQLSTRCNMSNAGLLHYFASKDELLAAVLEEIERREVEVVGPLVASLEAKIARGESTAEDLRRFFHALMEPFLKGPDLALFLVVVQAESIDPGHPAHAYFQSSGVAALALFERLLAPHVPNPRPMAQLLEAALTGLGQQVLRFGNTEEVLAVWDQTLSAIFAQDRPSMDETASA